MKFLWRLFRGFWQTLDRLRRLLANLLLLALLLWLFAVNWGEQADPLPEHAALLLNPAGVVVDQLSYIDPSEALLGGPGGGRHEVLLRDIIEAIHLAAEDPAITALVMELDYLVWVGISKAQEIAQALEVFRDSGKPIFAVGDYYSQDQYLLAAEAERVMMNPLGAVALEGYASYRNYYREALERLSVTMHVFQAGEHKSIAEPFLRDDMSPAEKRITARWLGQAWRQYGEAVEQRRGLEAGAVDDYVARQPQLLAEQGGDPARAALEAGLVDALMSREEANAWLAEQVGATDADGLYQAISFGDYLAANAWPEPQGERVAVITARGDILPGDHPAGSIGGDTLAWLIRDTARRPEVAAIVLRIDSGGGSVFASEIIRQQIATVRRQGLPVLVSMGAVAASGGYYIAAEADQIWATPATVTGSIGVFAAFPTFERLLDRFGVATDGVGTTGLAGALRVDRPLAPALAASLQSSVDYSYRHFLDIVGEGRELDATQLSAVAEGRVWNARDAQDRGLVDRLGSLDDAIAAAAGLAHLDHYDVEYVDLPQSELSLWLMQLSEEWGGLGLSGSATLPPALRRWVAQLTREFSSLQDPAHLYMRCLGCAAAAP